MSTNREEYVEALKQMLASSVMLGIRLSESGYEGQIRSDAKRPVLRAMGELNSSVEEFLSKSGLTEIDASSIFPLYHKVHHEH
jgi:hypothetical protein